MIFHVLSLLHLCQKLKLCIVLLLFFNRAGSSDFMDNLGVIIIGMSRRSIDPLSLEHLESTSILVYVNDGNNQHFYLVELANLLMVDFWGCRMCSQLHKNELVNTNLDGIIQRPSKQHNGKRVRSFQKHLSPWINGEASIREWERQLCTKLLFSRHVIFFMLEVDIGIPLQMCNDEVVLIFCAIFVKDYLVMEDSYCF